MKKYIIITFNYAGMGGAELYVRDKVEYIEKKGWKAYVFAEGRNTVNQEDILIEDLKKYASGIMVELGNYPQFYSKKQLDIIIRMLVNQIDYNQDDEIVIESHNALTACWGELLAHKCNGKHICFILNEIFYGDCIQFMDFKHKRRELAGTYDDSLIKMFKGYKNVPENERFYLLATNSQVIKDIEYNQLPDVTEYDWVISSLGRLEKKFVGPSLCEISKFAKEHKEKKILLILIASDENEQTKEMIKSSLNGVENVTLFVTGVLCPVPRKIFEVSDVFVSSATSAQMSACEGVPTITVDGNDFRGIGILGYTTSEDLYHESGKEGIDVSELLNQVLIEKICDKITFDKNKVWLFKQKDWMNILDSHMKFIFDSERKKEYYDIMKSQPNKKNYFKIILLRIFGAKLTNKLGDFKNKIINGGK